MTSTSIPYAVNEVLVVIQGVYYWYFYTKGKHNYRLECELKDSEGDDHGSTHDLNVTLLNM